MRRSLDRTARAGTGLLVMLCAMVLIGLATIVVAITSNADVSAAALFGPAGTVVTASAAALAALAATTVLLRGGTARFRNTLVVVLSAAAVLTVLMAFRFLTSGTSASIAGYLPALAAVALALISREVILADGKAR